MINKASLEMALQLENVTRKFYDSTILNLVFEGGGTKTISYAGAIKVLEKNGILKNVKNVAGSSAGGITAFLVALGFSATEIEKIICELDFSSFQDRSTMATILNPMGNLLSLVLIPGYKIYAGYQWLTGNLHSFGIGDLIEVLRTNGVYEGNVFLAWAKSTLQARGLDPNLTFKDLHELVLKGENGFKDLYLTGTNLNKQKIQYFCWEETPEVSIADALRATMSFPFAFKPYKILIKGELCEFGDGGMMNNYPMEIFDTDAFLYEGCQLMTILGHGFGHKNTIVNPCTLGLRVDSTEECASLFWNTSVNTEVTPALILESLIISDDDKVRNHYYFNTVQIHDMNISTLDFSIDKEQKAQMIANGETYTNQYFQLYRNTECPDETQKQPGSSSQQNPPLLPDFQRRNSKDSSYLKIQSGLKTQMELDSSYVVVNSSMMQ